MFRTLKTLFDGANARAEEGVRAAYSVELIDQKIREAMDGLKQAKLTLAGFIQRKRAEQKHIETLDHRIQDLTQRAQEALKGEREDLASEAARAIADLENERTTRSQTRDRLDTRIMRLESTIESVNRRIIDLKQGAIAARAAKSEHRMQDRLNNTLNGGDALGEAEELIKGVLNADDPFEQAEILRDIDAGLDGTDAASKLENAGFGAASKSSAQNVLERLKADANSK